MTQDHDNASPCKDWEPDIVIVTGGEGYLASHLIKQLLERGYTVRATVLELSEDSTKHLRLLDAALPGRLELFQADSLVPGSFDDAAAGAKFFFHLASPVVFGTSDKQKNQREIIDVAVSGARNAMHAAKKSQSVKRVVLTSSIAAMHNSRDNAPADAISPPKNGSLYTTEDWNEQTDVERSPYPASKVQAEREAWRLAKELQIDLVTILPSSICGPPVRPVFGYSVNSLKIHLEGASWSEMKVEAHIDVRDVALAHIRAAEIPTAQGRYFISFETTTDVKAIATALQIEFPFLPLATDAPSHSYRKYDNSKVKRDLGLSDECYTAVTQSFVDQARCMLASQLVNLKRC